MTSVRPAAVADRIRRELRRTFGLKQLREGQEPVIARVLAGRSTLALMPTGAGKSLCYQLPAMLLQGRTVVISPLIALMKDQCEGLRELGIAAVQVHGALSAAELQASHDALGDGSARIVFTTPEQLLHREFIEQLAKRPVALLVVDEAHCLSQWGFDFRPAFLEIGATVQALGRPTVLALTATATEGAVDDIIELLNIPRAGVIATGLLRPNLHYRAEYFSRAEDKMARLVALVHQSAGSGLVYASTVKAAEAVHQAVVSNGEPAGLYHGRMSAARRHAAQDAFMTGGVRVMVATNAFGLGIDKPDIRFVIHHQVPSGLGAYCQESGRAGRDGLAAECTLLFVDGDRSVQQFFLSGRYPGMAEFEAVVRALQAGEPQTSESLLGTLAEQLGGRRKSAVSLTMLQRHSIVEADAEGHLHIASSSAETSAPHALQPLVAACEQKALRDREMLERMVAYAQSGQCRWRLLLEHLEGTPALQHCGTCDNCRRLAAHEAAMANVLDADSADAIVVPEAKRFAIGERVKTRRHGPAEVVATDALSVTVRFDNGQIRNFDPRFLAAVKLRTRPRAPLAAP